MAIPSWHRLQSINNREQASRLPEQPESGIAFDASSTHDERANNAGDTEGTVDHLSPTTQAKIQPVASSTKRKSYPQMFEDFWAAYPRTPNMSKSEAFDAWKKLDDLDRARCLQGIAGYVAFLKAKPTLETIHACRFISRRRFDGFLETVANHSTGRPEDW